MLTIGFGVLFFTLVIVALVTVLMFAKAQLVASGEVAIEINDDPEKTYRVPSGGTLLNALAEQKVFIPSACGGQGTCGVCRVEITEGGGSILPTELTHVSRKEARGLAPAVQGSCRARRRSAAAVRDGR